MSAAVFLTSSERRKFSAYLRFQAETEQLLIDQVLKLPVPLNELIRVKKERIAAFNITANDLHNVEVFDVGDEEVQLCTRCGSLVSDWVDPDWSKGRICRSCEAKYEPPEPTAETRQVQSWNSRCSEAIRERDSLKAEIGDFQHKAYILICKLSGKEVDGAGSDAGWQEFTLAEIAEGMNYLKDRYDIDVGKLKAEVERLTVPECALLEVQS